MSETILGRALGYRRVSTLSQVESGLGLDAQRTEILAYAMNHGLFVAKIYSDEAVSGSAPLSDRKALPQLIQDIKAGDTVIIAKRDRIARDAFLARLIEFTIEKKGGVLVSASGEGNGADPSNRLMKTILDAFSEHERDLIRARTRAALAVKLTRGERRGGNIPYGYHVASDGIHLQLDEIEQETIKAAQALHESGLSLRAVSAELAAQRRFNRQGAPFLAMQVKRVVDIKNTTHHLGEKVTI